MLLGGTCFILPAALTVGVIAWAHVRFGTLPELAGLLYGIKPVVIGVVVQALWGLGPKAMKKSKLLGTMAAGACRAAALGVDALVVLVGASFMTIVARRTLDRSEKTGAAHLVGPVAAGAAGAAGVAVPVALLTLFLTFVKIGALVFGSGYVLFAFLRADLVDRLHWLSEPQLLDAVAIGQVTPGPVFTTATFIGYVISGPWGAVLATIGIFLPGFVLLAVTRLLIARIRQSITAAAFLDGVNVASLSLMAIVTAQVARAALVDAPAIIIIALVGTILLIRWKVNSTWLVAGAALVGALTHELPR
ncbi:MAG TPA: chromate efflux transporter [Polyangiales bacterium]